MADRHHLKSPEFDSKGQDVLYVAVCEEVSYVV